MQIFSYSITDLSEFESEPIEIAIDGDEDAVECGTVVARKMLEALPELARKGMCIAVCDDQGETVSIVPLDPVN